MGYVENAKDGTSVNGRVVILWNPLVGKQDNLTDIIGEDGNSGFSNFFMIDCEMLQNPCKSGDVISVDILEDETPYVSRGEKNITITTEAFDVIEGLSVNSPPRAYAILPDDFQRINKPFYNFSCLFEDDDGDLVSGRVLTNISGEWGITNTSSISGFLQLINFSLNLPEGSFKYQCEAEDSFLKKGNSQNKTFFVDYTSPDIFITLNSTYSCGSAESIRVLCVINDISPFNITLKIENPLGQTFNYSPDFFEENRYYKDLFIDTEGEWRISCFAEDSFNNSAENTSFFNFYEEDFLDIFLNNSEINLSNEKPVENEIVFITSKVYVRGCIGVENLKVSYYLGDPSFEGTNLGNETINISKNSFNISKIPWSVEIGPKNIFVIADPDERFNDSDKENNKINKTFSIPSWQSFYGNLSVSRILGLNFNKTLSNWLNSSFLDGNIFIADKNSVINWNSLQALGKKINGENSSNDFQELDFILNMTNFEDSITKRYLDEENKIRETFNFTIYGKEIKEVPVINSSSFGNFKTGILWDYSDSNSDEFNSLEKQRIVFVSKINLASQGEKGICDYEITIPVRLREYEGPDFEEVYLYYSLY
ncbi:MAG: hypothetical protein QW273_01190 [Candidatus Pacearchaeota archaeon]